MDAEEKLIGHYSETCELQREAVKLRNKLFVLLCVNTCVLYLLIFSETDATTALHSWMKNNLSIDIALSASVITVFCWIVFLYTTMRYIQSNVNIERQYQYIHQLEKDISNRINVTFEREGKNYLEDYPFVLNIIDFLYKWFFPLFFIVTIAVKVFIEILIHTNIACTICDSLIGGTVILLWTSYLFFLHSKKK